MKHDTSAIPANYGTFKLVFFGIFLSFLIISHFVHLFCTRHASRIHINCFSSIRKYSLNKFSKKNICLLKISTIQKLPYYFDKAKLCNLKLFFQVFYKFRKYLTYIMTYQDPQGDRSSNRKIFKTESENILGRDRQHNE